MTYFGFLAGDGDCDEKFLADARCHLKAHAILDDTVGADGLDIALEGLLVEEKNPGESSRVFFDDNELAQGLGEQVEQLIGHNAGVKSDFGDGICYDFDLVQVSK